jgi:hypothetical protein
MKTISVDLAIPADEYLALYQGIVKDVVAKARDGRVVRFPANILQRFVSHAGVYGSFVIYFDDNNKFSHVEQVA